MIDSSTASSTLRTPSRQARHHGRVLHIPSIPLFERLVYYLLIPDLFSRIVLELGMGIYWYSITQPKQWVLYLLLLVEYVFQLRTIHRAKFIKGLNLTASVLFMTMFLHGFLGGIAWGNGLPKIVTDSVPVLVMAINTCLLSRVDAFRGFGFRRVTVVIRIYAIVMLLAGAAAVSLGKPSIVSLGGGGGGVATSLCLAVLLASMMIKPRISGLDVLILAVILIPIAPNMTRTTLAVFLLAFTAFVMPKVFRSGVAVYLSVIFVMLTAVTFPLVVPTDSPLMGRLNAIAQLAESSGDSVTVGEGSLGERAAEVEAIADEMDRRGPNAHLFGLGAGGTYHVEFTGGRVPENYSHAHYSWALFKLRYGYIGYFYLAAFSFFLIANLVKTWKSNLFENKMIFILGLWGVLFMFTYMYYNLLVIGLQISAHQPEARRRPAGARQT